MSNALEEYLGATLEERVAVPGVEEKLGSTYILYDSDIAHRCGARGYNPQLGDSCPRCDYDREALEKLRRATRS